MKITPKMNRPLQFHELRTFQLYHRAWLEHNFPNQKPHEALLGLGEEVGELMHAHLKRDQGIRGVDDVAYRNGAMDAVGDIMIYLASYCNTNNLDMAKCLMYAWEEVRARDWIKYPKTGVAPTEQPTNAESSQGDSGYSE
jgi:NTP pyrophosphatase (non-canonical NTP hydrolase)